MKEKAANIGLIPIDAAVGRRDINDYIKSEQAKWGALVEKLGLKGTQ